MGISFHDKVIEVEVISDAAMLVGADTGAVTSKIQTDLDGEEKFQGLASLTIFRHFNSDYTCRPTAYNCHSGHRYHIRIVGMERVDHDVVINRSVLRYCSGFLFGESHSIMLYNAIFCPRAQSTPFKK